MGDSAAHTVGFLPRQSACQHRVAPRQPQPSAPLAVLSRQSGAQGSLLLPVAGLTRPLRESQAANTEIISTYFITK